MVGFTDTSLQLKSIMTARNQRMSTTRSVPYWTTSVFSSTMTNDEWRISAEWILLGVLTCPPFIISGEPNTVNCHCVINLVLNKGGPNVDCVTPRMCLPKRCLAMDCSGFQASCHNTVMTLRFPWALPPLPCVFMAQCFKHRDSSTSSLLCTDYINDLNQNM
jgi:hypothetical protein